MCSRISWCIGKSYFVEKYHKKVNKLTDDDMKDYMNIRYLRVVSKLEESTKRTTFLYHSLSFVITVGSILVPALISVQDKTTNPVSDEDERQEHSNNIFWSVWGISLGVTVSNAVIKLLSLDKSFITRNIKLNQFKSEGVLYFSKAGIYATANEKERFRLFVSNIEKLKRDQVLEEFTQNQEELESNQPRASVNNTGFTMI